MLLACCVAAPELGGVAAASTPSPGGAVAKTGSVVLVARRGEASHRERKHIRRYLRKHPNVLTRKIAKYPGYVVRHMRKGATAKPGAKAVQTANHKKRRAHRGAKRHKRKAGRKAKHKKRRRRAGAAAGVAAAHKHKAKGKGGKKGNKAKNSDKSLSMTDWLEIGLLVLAPFAAVALLLYITDLRRRPRAPSRTKRRRSLVITPNKG
jgi:hypothetical protein